MSKLPEIEERFQSLDNCQSVSLALYSGVYFLFKGTRIVYVGQSRHIDSRIRQHFGNKDFDSIQAMAVPEELLDSVEVYWIQRLRPILNRRKSGTELEKFFDDLEALNDSVAGITPEVIATLTEAQTAELHKECCELIKRFSVVMDLLEKKFPALRWSLPFQPRRITTRRIRRTPRAVLEAKYPELYAQN